MQEWIDLVRYLHVLGAVVLFGTGIGIAFFMVLANRTKDAGFIAHVSGTVVIADTVFTATAAILQPITGIILAKHYGWPLFEGWVFVSILLYIFVGLFWLPVVAIQIKMRNHARLAHQQNMALPTAYTKLYRIWFCFGSPAFTAMMAIFWLMLFRPDITISF